MNATQKDELEATLIKEELKKSIRRFKKLKHKAENEGIAEEISTLIDMLKFNYETMCTRKLKDILSPKWEGRRLEMWVVGHSDIKYTTKWNTSKHDFDYSKEGKYNFINWRGDKALYRKSNVDSEHYDGFVPESNRYPDIVLEDTMNNGRKIAIECKYGALEISDDSTKESILASLNKKMEKDIIPDLDKYCNSCKNDGIDISALYFVIGTGWRAKAKRPVAVRVVSYNECLEWKKGKKIKTYLSGSYFNNPNLHYS